MRELWLDNPRFTFHGAFASKAAAQARERRYSGAFIRPFTVRGQRRYGVVTKRNPRAPSSVRPISRTVQFCTTLPARKHRRNPVVAVYNPRRNTDMAHRRHHRHHHRRHHYRHNPPFSAIMSHPGDVIMPGVVGMASAVGVVTVGNYIQTQFLSTFTMGGTSDILIRAAVRGAVAYGGDMLVKHSKWQGAYRTGAAIGIIGSALLEFMGKTFSLGVGDSAQMPQTVLGFAGAGAYTHLRLAGARVAGVNAYTRATMLQGASVGALDRSSNLYNHAYSPGA